MDIIKRWWECPSATYCKVAARAEKRVWDREKFSVASMGRRKCALWTSGTGARSTCGLTDLRIGPVGGGGAIVEIPYLALTEDFSEVRDI